MTKTKKTHRWFLTTTLIVFILFVATLPFVVSLTYSGRSESPDHILYYTRNKLEWNSATGIQSNGVAELSLFDASYDNVKSEDGVNVIAPGTTGYDIVRLKNNASGTIKYTAVVYRIKNNDDLDVEVSLSGSLIRDAEKYTLPEGVDNSSVIRAVRGTLYSGWTSDFDIAWNWNFTEGNDRDAVDTYLGNKAAGGDIDDVTIGIYIVVEDDNKYVFPEKPPKTGDDGMTSLYYTLFVICGITLLLLLLTRKRKEDEEEISTPCQS